jgi:hypothetical protein
MMTLENLSLVELSMIFNPAFLPAFRRLTVGLHPLNWRDICAELIAHITALEAGQPSPMTLLGAVPIMIVVLHIEEGRPLHLTDELLDLWISESDGNPRECPDCGYRVPCTVPRCVLCGSATGPAGIFNERRKAKAAMN